MHNVLKVGEYSPLKVCSYFLFVSLNKQFAFYLWFYFASVCKWWFFYFICVV